MERVAIQINEELVRVKGQQNKYLTFSFFDKGYGMKLEFVGYTELRKKPRKPGGIKGYVRFFEREMPVFDLRGFFRKDIGYTANRFCIIIFRCGVKEECYFGMVVEDVLGAINIANGTQKRLLPLLLSAKEHLSHSSSIDWVKILSSLSKVQISVN